MMFEGAGGQVAFTRVFGFQSALVNPDYSAGSSGCCLRSSSTM